MSNLRPYPFGFKYGAMVVERVMGDDRVGHVLTVYTKTKCVTIRVSPKGNRVDVSERPSNEREIEEAAR